jgi:hypothetical protein
MSYENEEEQNTDRRHERRWNIPVPVVVEGVDRDGKEFREETITSDASPSGMCILLSKDLREKQQITVTAPDEKFESQATVRDVSPLNPNMNRVRVDFPKGKTFSRDLAAKKYIYNYDWANWIGYIVDNVFYSTKYEPLGRVEEFRIVEIDSEAVLYRLRGDRVYDEHAKCLGHII